MYRVLLKRYLPADIARLFKWTELRINKLIYSGNTFLCPYCSQTYRLFKSGGITNQLIEKMDIIGAGIRQNMVCPGCGSTDRDRLLYAYFDHEFKFLRPKKLLHIAPEPCLNSYFKNIVSISYVFGAKFHEGLYYPKELEIINLEHLQYADNTFDWVVCNHVLEHVEDEFQSLAEILRVLTPGGKAVLQVPWSPKLEITFEDPTYVTESDRLKHYGQDDHLRLFGKDYPGRIAKAGFKVSIIKPYDLPLIADNKVNLSINPRELIFVGEKQTS